MARSVACRGESRESRTTCATAPDLSVPRLRRSRSRAQARTEQRAGRRSVCDGARDAGRAARRRIKNLTVLEAEGALGPYGFRDASTTRVRSRASESDGRRLHGAPHRNEHRRVRQRAETEYLAAPLSPRPACSLGGADAAGENSAAARAPGSCSATTRAHVPSETEKPAVRELDTAEHAAAADRILGNVPYTIDHEQLRAAACSRYGRLAVNRWRNDGTRDNYGQWCYVKDLSNGRLWSAASSACGAPKPTGTACCLPAIASRSSVATATSRR